MKNANANNIKANDNSKKFNVRTNATTRRELPQPCFILTSKQQIIYNGEQVLPYVHASDKEVLDLLGLPYVEKTKFDQEICEYWDPECEEFVNATLPLYFKGHNKTYTYAKKHNGVIPSEHMWNAAAKLRDMVEKTLKAYRRERYIQSVLQGHCTAVTKSDRMVGSVNWNGKDIVVKTLETHKGSGEYIHLFFDMNKIRNEEYDYLIVTLPNEFRQYHIAGTEGNRIDFWAAQLGLKKIFLKYV